MLYENVAEKGKFDCHLVTQQFFVTFWLKHRIKNMTTPSRKLRHTAVASLTVFTSEYLFIIESLKNVLIMPLSMYFINGIAGFAVLQAVNKCSFITRLVFVSFSFLRMSSFLRLSSFLSLSSFLRLPLFLVCLIFWGGLHF